ncbi:MAG: F0F1 ATP synthase subunit B [Bacilli bacterium]|nr:F0F1 ATP synthase subunit B [Bacilli bacterium]MDY6430865.1 F0F1 ATP synthase subunit B [Bacilli bacterium]
MIDLSNIVFALKSSASSESNTAAPGSNPFSADDFVNKVFPNNIWELVIQIAAFVILLLIVFFIAYKPVKKMLKKRGDFIETNINEALEKNKIATEAALNKEKTIEEGKLEASRIINAAKIEAAAEANKILAEAKEDAAKVKKKADEDIKLAKEQSLLETRNEMVDVALSASSVLLGREINDEDNSRLVSDFINSINSKEGK